MTEIAVKAIETKSKPPGKIFSEKYTKVDPQSPEYQRHLSSDVITKIRQDLTYPFTQPVLEAIDNIPLDDPNRQQNIALALVPARQRIEKTLNSNPAVKLQVKKLLRRYFISTPTPTTHQINMFEQKVEDMSFSDEEILEGLRQYQKEFEALRKSFYEIAPDMKQEFSEKLFAEISERGLDIDKQSLREKIEQVRLGLLDPLKSVEVSLVGGYDDQANTAAINPYLPEDEARNTFDHEMLHGISGITITHEEVYGDDGENLTFDQYYNTQRMGVQYDAIKYTKKDPEKENERVKRFAWLNEAITEEFSNITSGYNSTSYKSERKLFDLLCSSWIPDDEEDKDKLSERIKNEAYEAYFEDYKPDDPNRLIKWKNFQRSMNDAYGRGFLVRLDNCVRQSGVVAGIKYMEDYRAAHFSSQAA